MSARHRLAPVVVGRDDKAIECRRKGCHGYAPRVDDVTEAEWRAHGCGRSWACCTRAFKCNRCGDRVVVKSEAPEMD